MSVGVVVSAYAVMLSAAVPATGGTIILRARILRIRIQSSDNSPHHPIVV